MNWIQIEEQHKKNFNRDYVACHEPAERAWLIEQVQFHFPAYRKSVVEQAVQQVCSDMKITPRKRKEFLERLQLTLESKRAAVANSLTKTQKPTTKP